MKGAWRIDEENPLLFSFSRFRYFFRVSRHVSCALCPAAYYAPLHKAVYVACNPYRAAKDKVTLRNCFPWDEAKLAISSFPSFRSLRSPVFRVSLFFNPPPPRFPRLYHSFLSTSFRRDARRQKATAPQRAKERAGIRAFASSHTVERGTQIISLTR